MDLLSSCVYLSQVNEMSSKSRNQQESNGPLNAHDFSKNAVGRSMPKRKQFSIFNIFKRRTKQIKKEGTQSNTRTVFVCDLPVS
jgi:hypothetical protein